MTWNFGAPYSFEKSVEVGYARDCSDLCPVVFFSLWSKVEDDLHSTSSNVSSYRPTSEKEMPRMWYIEAVCWIGS